MRTPQGSIGPFLWSVRYYDCNHWNKCQRKSEVSKTLVGPNRMFSSSWGKSRLSSVKTGDLLHRGEKIQTLDDKNWWNWSQMRKAVKVSGDGIRLKSLISPNTLIARYWKPKNMSGTYLRWGLILSEPERRRFLLTLVTSKLTYTAAIWTVSDRLFWVQGRPARSITI